MAAFGLLLCLGFFSPFVTSEQFRIVKHLFYLLIAVLLVADLPSCLQVARRDPWIWALVALMCTSALWSDSSVWVIKRSLVTLQTTTFGLYLALRLSLDDHLRVLAWVLLLTLAANLAYLATAPDNAFMLYQDEPAFRGLLGHKNGVGLVTALALPILLLQAGAPGPLRLVMLSGVAGALVLLLLSRSLTGASVALTLCMVVALAPVSRRLRRPAVLLGPPAVLAIASIAAASGLVDGVLARLGRSPTFSGRTEIWQQALPVIFERPLLGHSLVSFWQQDIVRGTQFWFSHAHNGFLQMAIDLGAVGLILLVLQMSSTLLHALRWHRRQPGPGATWPICVCSLFVLYNFTEVLLMRENSIFWVLVVAASLSVRRAEAQRPRVPRRRGARSTEGLARDRSGVWAER